MAWTHIPVSDDAFIDGKPFDEIMERIRILWMARPNRWGSRELYLKSFPEECHGGNSFWYWYYVDDDSQSPWGHYGSPLGWMRRVLQAMHNYSGWGSKGNAARWYWDSGLGLHVARPLSWVLTECGVDDWTQIEDSGGTPYYRGSKLKTPGDCLVELTTVIDYIYENARVCPLSDFSSASSVEGGSWGSPWNPHETNWADARARVTGEIREGYTEFLGGPGGAYGRMPFAIAILRQQPLGEWDLPSHLLYNKFVQKSNGGVLPGHIVRMTSGSWSDAMTNPGCQYWLRFQGTPSNPMAGGYDFSGFGCVPLPYTLNGNTIEVGGMPGNGGDWVSPREVPFNYRDWDWVNNRGDILCDDSGWGGDIFVPDDGPASPDWDGGDEAMFYTAYMWTQVPPSVVIIKPVYSGW